MTYSPNRAALDKLHQTIETKSAFYFKSHLFMEEVEEAEELLSFYGEAAECDLWSFARALAMVAIQHKVVWGKWVVATNSTGQQARVAVQVAGHIIIVRFDGRQHSLENIQSVASMLGSEWRKAS